MADMKPNPIARLIKGKTLYCVDNFCATMNWLISCWHGVRARYGVKITGVDGGEPVIEADLAGGPGVKVEPYRDAPTKISANLAAGPGASVTEDADTGALCVAANLVAGDNVTLEPQSTGEIKISAAGGLTLKTATNSVGGVNAVVLKSGSESNVKFDISSETDAETGLTTATVSVNVYWFE